MKKITSFLIFVAVLLGLVSSHFAFADAGRFLRDIPVQDQGRIKPFDTFSREAVSYISGRSSFDGKSSIHVVVTWILAYKHWNKTPFILIKKHSVKQALELDVKRSHFSPKELEENTHLKRELEELRIRQEKKEELDDYFTEIQTIYSRWMLYQSIQKGMTPLWHHQDEKWHVAIELPTKRQQELVEVFSQYSQSILSKKTNEAFKQTTEKLKISSLKGKINTEVHYNALNPFRWSWMLYLLGLVLWLLLMIRPKYQKIAFLIPVISAFILHTYGIILRCYIMSRPPVSNMYETLLWVPWVALFFAFIFQRIRKIEFPVVAGAVCAFLCLFVSDQAFGILNGKLEPLEAVLRSNFWLSTHSIGDYDVLLCFLFSIYCRRFFIASVFIEKT